MRVSMHARARMAEMCMYPPAGGDRPRQSASCAEAGETHKRGKPVQVCEASLHDRWCASSLFSYSCARLSSCARSLCAYGVTSHPNRCSTTLTAPNKTLTLYSPSSARNGNERRSRHCISDPGGVWRCSRSRDCLSRKDWVKEQQEKPRN